ncbi:MAG: EamA family transporter [Verrucomicrobia bacterium]|nr:EamA family transporter [Verrucomicrobiota bacterium]
MEWLVWSVLSAVFAGATAVLAKVGVTGVSPNFATAIRTAVVLAFTILLVWLVDRPAGWPVFAAGTWVFLILSGIATGLSWLCYFRALQVGEVTKVAPIDKLSVVVAMGLSAVFLGERLSPKEILGAALIVAGAVVLAWPS